MIIDIAANPKSPTLIGKPPTNPKNGRCYNNNKVNHKRNLPKTFFSLASIRP
jgi:hypothetical protein